MNCFCLFFLSHGWDALECLPINTKLNQNISLVLISNRIKKNDFIKFIFKNIPKKAKLNKKFLTVYYDLGLVSVTEGNIFSLSVILKKILYIVSKLFFF